jgi:hypothetical protein
MVATRSQPRARRQREAGAAMLVVMLMLLVGTTLAAMTVHTITLEMRSAGYYRQQAQTHYVAESAMQGVLSIPANNIWERWKALRLAVSTTPLLAEAIDINDPNLMRNYGEPDPALIPGGQRPVLRLPAAVVETMLVSMPGGGGLPVLAGANESLGTQAFTPWYVVDFTDVQVDDSATAVGANLAAGADQIYFLATVTVRGRTMLDDGSGTFTMDRGPSSTVAGEIYQKFTDAAYDMRAVVRFGPVPR